MPDVWPAGTATGLGPFPGIEPLEAARMVLTELAAPALPFLPELPARRVGADPVGRTAGLLADLHVEVGTGVWRFVRRPGRDEQRAHAALTADLDALEEAGEGYDGPLKVRILGPWTLAAGIELRKGEKALADEGAVRDVTASLAEGLGRHLADLRRRLPGLTRLVVQVDEPQLGAVLAGELSTASGWGRLRAYERAVVEDGLRRVLAAAGDSDAPGAVAGVWIGAGPLDGGLLRAAGAAFVGIDGSALDSVDEDEIGETVDAGAGLLVACVPLEPGARRDPRPVTEPVRSLWKRIGFPIGELATSVALMPVEGLEQLDRSAVPGVLQRAVEAARLLEESAAEEES
ncbi:MAG TPA: methionine synthase [Acidimicrobiia bacterium]|nr:methionine synthase [Acidimicrobiia bacterium]